MRAGDRGFTLLEVMVSVAILGLGLTAILSAQAGAFANAALARNMGVATGLVRCKMTELEEHLTRDGFQELDEADTGPCCEGDETPGMHCSWKIEKPQLPEPKYGELNLDTDVGSSDLGALGELTKGADGTALGPDAKLGDAAQLLAGAQGGAEGPAGAAGAAQGILGTVMEMVYPDIKSLFEASTRRVTVKVTWTQGSREQSIELVQWFAIPQKGVAPKDPEDVESETDSETSADRNSPSGKPPKSR
jgi:general secretion pathway protein I